MGDGKDLVDRAERKAVARRMREAEPAPTYGRARVEVEMARRILRHWWAPFAWLAFGVVDLLLLLNVDHAAPLWVRVCGVQACAGSFALAAWQELQRRGASRLLDANRRRWGDV